MENDETVQKRTASSIKVNNDENKSKKSFMSKKGKVLTAGVAGTLMGILSSAAMRFKSGSDDAHPDDSIIDESVELDESKNTGVEDAANEAVASDKHDTTTSNKVDDSIKVQENNDSNTMKESDLREEIEHQVRGEMEEEVDSLRKKISDLENQIEEQSDKEEFTVLDVTTIYDDEGNPMDFIVANENGVMCGFLDIDNDGYADFKLVDYNHNGQFDLNFTGDAIVNLGDEMIDMKVMAEQFREGDGSEIDDNPIVDSVVKPVLPEDTDDSNWTEVDLIEPGSDNIDDDTVAEVDFSNIVDDDPDYNNHADVSDFNKM